MAQLKDLIVNGDARIIGKLYANQSLPDGVFHLANVSGTAAVTSSPYTAAKWQTTADDPRITSLYSGLTISLKIPVAGNGTYGTLLNVNGLGDHPVVYNVNNYISTRYAVGSTIHLTYNATQTATAYNNGTSATTYTGCWQMEDYDSTNTYQLRNSHRTIVNADAGTLYRYELCLSNKGGELIPYNNVDNATTTYNKALTEKSFNPFGPIFYYNSTTNINAGALPGTDTLYTHIIFDVRRAFNIQSDGTSGTTALTPNQPVYIMAAYNEPTGLASLIPDILSSSYLDRSSIWQGYLDDWLNEEYILIYLGIATSKYQVELAQEHPVYKYNTNGGYTTIYSGGGGSVGPASKTTLGTLRAWIDENTNTLYLSNQEYVSDDIGR